MKFGPVPIALAEGAILAHSVRLDGRKLKKGSRLTAKTVAALAEAGVTEITAARLDPGDLHEDEAAERLARAVLDGDDVRLTRATTGRVNLVAEGPGLVQLDAARIAEMNAIDPMVTVATVPAWTRMEANGLIATVKIISYAVPGTAVAAAERAGAGAIRLLPAVRKTAALIETEVAGGPTGKGAEGMRTRLERLGADMTAHQIVPHDVAALAHALRDTRAEILMILTGSATSDSHDVAPEGVRAAGGVVHRFGMPVDPGNLLFLGELDGKPVIGLPGCARSPALNGADFVLERLVCGVEVTSADIAGMGVGGLLKEIPTRPQPRRKGG